ncbi:MAG: glycosyl hydrolase 108 family protein [bacterium]|nr:glycosyl hydrolase 108 family protein [bacterium]
MSERFNSLIEEILRHEGGYVFDPADPGGETNFGISARAHPDVDIVNLTRDRAMEIYRTDYWRVWMDKINDPILCLQVFDFAVNAGLPKAAIFLQRTVGVAEDSIIGPITLTAVNDIGRQLYIRRRFLENCLLYYHGIGMNRVQLDKFIKAWFRRAIENAVR